jgi:predicted SprT family Zn-dependent metalloprotease
MSDATWVTDGDFLCPWCGKRQTDTWEFVGELRGGDTYECQRCEKPIEIVQIDYTAHLNIRRGTGER